MPVDDKSLLLKLQSDKSWTRRDFVSSAECICSKARNSATNCGTIVTKPPTQPAEPNGLWSDVQSLWSRFWAKRATKQPYKIIAGAAVGMLILMFFPGWGLREQHCQSRQRRSKFSTSSRCSSDKSRRYSDRYTS